MKGFLRFFKEHPPTFAKQADSTAMTVGGRRYNYDDLNSIDRLFDAQKVLSYDLVDWWKSPPEEKVGFLKGLVEGTYRKEIFDLRRAKVEAKEKLRANGKSHLALPDAEYILQHLHAFRVLGVQKREAGVHFWDTKTQRVTPYDYYSVESALKAAHVDKDMISQFMTQALHTEECYNPHGDYGLTLIPDTNNVYRVNRYVLPEWRTLTVEPDLPGEIAALMTHLFPKEECREFVYTWIYHSLTSRCGTYLYLCGGQASGKNTLAQVIAALHGEPNSSNPKQDAIYGRFNQYLKCKRFVFFDEFNCRGRQDKDTLKRIINDRIQIEAKGKDHEDIEIHASYFIANNSREAIGIEPIDRRFSVPDVTDAPILTALGKDFITDLLVKIKDPAFIAAFGNWLLREFREPRWTAEEPYQKARFEEIVLATQRQGIADTLVKVLNREQNEYVYLEERQAFHRTYKGQHYPSLLDWLKFFREVKKNGQPLGSVEGAKFFPRDEFKVEQ